MNRSDLEAELEKHHRESYTWALNCCSRSRDDAEVVLQIVYIKILEGRARFNGKATFKTWLFSVIRKTAADERRRRILRSLKLVRLEENSARSIREEHPDEAIYRLELQSLLEQAFAALPRRQREVLQLVFYHDLSLAEAAEVMRVSVGSARTHYERGKKQLRQQMAKAKVMDEPAFGRRENKRAIF